MADSKISALASGAPAQAGDEYVVARSGANYKLTLTNIAANMPATTVASGNLLVSSGNVGIGTASPNVQLHLSQAAGDQVIKMAGQTVTWGFRNQSDGSFGAFDYTNSRWLDLYSYPSSYRAFYTGASERMRIDSSGNVGIGMTPGAANKVDVGGTLPTSSNYTEIIRAGGTIPSGSTSNVSCFISYPATQAASFTLGTLYHFRAVQNTFGAGSAVSSQAGFFVDSSLTGAANNYGFYSNIASGSNRWNFYANGTARNYFAGGVEDAAGNLRNIPSAGAAKTSAYTLTITDIGEFVTVGTSGSITVPNDTFAAGNAISIYNDTTGNITINCPITTAYLAGTNTDRASLTLATRGIATILFINPSLCVASGNLT